MPFHVSQFPKTNKPTQCQVCDQLSTILLQNLLTEVTLSGIGSQTDVTQKKEQFSMSVYDEQGGSVIEVI